MKYSKFRLIIIIVLFISTIASAQNKWSLEFRPNIDFPKEDFKNLDIPIGFGFEVTFAYQFIEQLSTNAGWGYNIFDIKDSNFTFDEAGYTFGLQFIHLIENSEILFYLFRIGGVYNHLELEDSDGNLVDNSGHKLGWQIEASINYALDNNLNLRPTVRSRSLS